MQILDKSNAEKFSLYFIYLVTIVFGEYATLRALCFRLSTGTNLTYTFGSVILLAISAVAFVRLFHISSKRPESLFVLVAPVLLAGFAFFMMPFAVPDEFTHIYRVFNNTSHQPVIEIPAQLPPIWVWLSNYAELAEALTVQFNYDLVTETDHCAAAYSAINYAVPSLVAKLGCHIGLNGYLVIYAARLSNAFIFLIAGWWIIKNLPNGKIFAFIFLLNPMLLQQQASCSADALCNIATLCFVTQIAIMRLSANPIRIQEWLKLLFFFFLVAVCKYAYIPLALLMLVLYPKIQNSYIKKSLPFLVLFVLVFGAIAIYAMGYSELLGSYAAIDPEVGFITNLLMFILVGMPRVVWMFAGGNLGWPIDGPLLDCMVRVPYLWAVYLVLLFAAIFTNHSDGPFFSLKARVLIVLTVAINAALINIALMCDGDLLLEPLTGACAIPSFLLISGYLTGVQGRYFFPLFFILAFAIFPKRGNFLNRIPVSVWMVLVVSLDLLVLAYVTWHFIFC